MGPHEIIKATRGFLAETAPDHVDNLSDDTNLFELKVLDSLGILSLVMFLEEKFDITLTHEDLTEENFRSLNALAELISTKKAA